MNTSPSVAPAPTVPRTAKERRRPWRTAAWCPLAQAIANGPQARSTVGDHVNRWFVVAESSRRQDDQEVVLAPTSKIHAKEMGTLVTACGIRCESWPKWWDQPFPLDLDSDSCLRCREIVLHR